MELDKTTIIGAGIGLGLLLLVFNKSGSSRGDTSAAVAIDTISAQTANAPALLQAYNGLEAVRAEAEQMRLAASNAHDAATFDFLSSIDTNKVLNNAQALQFGADIIDINTKSRAVGFAHDENMFGLTTDRANSLYGLESLRIQDSHKHDENMFLNTSERLYQNALTELSRLDLTNQFDLASKEQPLKYTLANKSLDVDQVLGSKSLSVQENLGLTQINDDLQKFLVGSLYDYNLGQRGLTVQNKSNSKNLIGNLFNRAFDLVGIGAGALSQAGGGLGSNGGTGTTINSSMA